MGDKNENDKVNIKIDKKIRHEKRWNWKIKNGKKFATQRDKQNVVPFKDINSEGSKKWNYLCDVPIYLSI